MESSVTSPGGGAVTISEAPASSPLPSGFQVLGQAVNISAPDASAANPLVLKFLLDGSLFTGLDINTVTVFKDGAAVPNCTAVPPAAISPEPSCVALRQMVGDDLEITVYSLTASEWGFGVGSATPTPSPAPTPTPGATGTPPAGPTCDGRPATIVGTNGNNFIVGTRHADVIVALGGHDLVFGMGGDDVICLGEGKDIAFGGKGNDRIFGERGKDHLFGEKGNDYLDGGPDRDDCSGGSGANTLVNCEKGHRHDDDRDDHHDDDDDHDDRHH